MATPRTPDFGRQVEHVIGPYAHAQPTANTDQTDKLFVIPAGKKFRVDKVDYVNPTGLAAGAGGYIINIMKGATSMAKWSTVTGQEGTIAADTFVALTLSATDADRVAAGGDEIRLFLDASGTATLPPGRVTIHGRYV